MSVVVGAAGREILRACWRARGPVTFAANYRGVGVELYAMGLVSDALPLCSVGGELVYCPPHWHTPVTGVRLVPTERGLAVGRALCDVRWAELWTELANRLVSDVLLVQVREGQEAAARLGRRAQRARQRARLAFSRAYGSRPL